MKRMGLKVDVVTKTINYINETYPAIFTIADAKRGGEYLDVCKAFF
jgi:hypothetical protein